MLAKRTTQAPPRSARPNAPAVLLGGLRRSCSLMPNSLLPAPQVRVAVVGVGTGEALVKGGIQPQFTASRVRAHMATITGQQQ